MKPSPVNVLTNLISRSSPGRNQQGEWADAGAEELLLGGDRTEEEGQETLPPP